MSKAQFYTCDGPGCAAAKPGGGSSGYLPDGWYTVTWSEPKAGYVSFHFHSRDCMRAFVLALYETERETKGGAAG